MTKNLQNTYSLKSLMMWIIPTVFFTFQFIPRLWLGQNADYVMEQLSINQEYFGYITALYYFGYSGMQIPVAMMLDRFQPRYVISGLIFLFSGAFLIFTLTDNWIVAAIARFFIGVGSAGGFLGMSKVISQWFDRKTYAKLLGPSIGIGILGAVYGGGPTYLLVEKYGVNAVAFGIIGVGLFLAFTVLFCISAPKNSYENAEKFTVFHLKELISSPIIWVLGAVNLLLVGPLEGFADVWAERYFTHFFGFEKSSALELASFVFVGLIAASPIMPFLGKKIGNYALINLSGLGIVACFVVLFMHWAPSWLGVAITLFMMGVFSAYQTNLLAAGIELVRPVLMGVTIAFLNSWNMFGGTLFHSAIGMIMETDNKASMVGVVKESTYIAALGTIPLAAAIGVLLMCCIWIFNVVYAKK